METESHPICFAIRADSPPSVSAARMPHPLAENVSWIAVLSLKKVLRELHNKFDGILLTAVVAQMVISGLLSPHSRPFGGNNSVYFIW